MDASLTERRRVRDEGLRVVNRFGPRERVKLDRSEKQGRAKFVPAAAVIREPRALSGITGRKECVGGVISLLFNPSAQPKNRRGNGYT